MSALPGVLSWDACVSLVGFVSSSTSFSSEERRGALAGLAVASILDDFDCKLWMVKSGQD